MPATVRRPILNVLSNGVSIPRVTAVSIQRGLDQQYSKAQFTVGYPAHGQLKKGSHVIILCGANILAAERFVGYIADPGAQMWPGRITFDCVDVMGYLANVYPASEISFNGMTDTEIIHTVLDEAQIPTNMRIILGLDEIVGDFGTDVPAITWPQEESALEVITEIDDMSIGFRTRALPNGVICRKFVSHIPGAMASKEFVEGVNIMTGSMQMSEFEPTTQVMIVGDGGNSFVASSSSNPYAWLTRPYWRQHAAVQMQGSTVGFLSTEDIANHVLGIKNRNLMKFSFATQDDDQLDVGNTVFVDSVHSYVVQNAIIQNLTIQADSSGKFRQNLTVVSEIMDNESGIPVQVAFGPTAGQTLTPTPTTPLAPSNLDVFATFTIVAIDHEILDDGSDVFVVTCADMSTSAQGLITDRAWTASGTGVVIASGSEQTFTTGFTTLTGAAIELTVTDSNGSTNSQTQNPEGAGVPVRIRKLYSITTSTFEAFDGQDWRTWTPSNAASMTAIAGGPYAAAGDLFIGTLDDLVTSPSEVVIQSGVTITALWVEPDVNINNLAAGFIDGSTATSSDGGFTWTVRSSPGGAPVRRIIISRFTEGQIHAITDTGYYVSDNYGDSWSLFLAGDFIDLQLSHSRNVLVTSAGDLIDTSGTAFTFPSLSPPVVIKAATAHIRQDKFYAIDDQGRTFQQYGLVSGSFAMSQGVDIPEGTGIDRGAYRDGLLVDMVYFVTGISLWKTLDGFRTSGGYLKLRS